MPNTSKPPLNLNYSQFCPALWRKITSKEQWNRDSNLGAMSQRVRKDKVKGSLQFPTLLFGFLTHPIEKEVVHLRLLCLAHITLCSGQLPCHATSREAMLGKGLPGNLHPRPTAVTVTNAPKTHRSLPVRMFGGTTTAPLFSKQKVFNLVN